jgi:apolipoprotein N-acyltransferase
MSSENAQLWPYHGVGIPLLITVAIIGAAAFLLAFPPVSIWPAIFIAPAAFAWVALSARSTRAALFVTFLVNLALWLWFGRWLVQVSEFGYPFHALYLSLYPTIFVWLVRRIYISCPFPLASSFPFALTIPLIWTGIETLRGELAFNGYPWFLIAHPLIDATEMVQSADLFGTYFVSFLVAMISGLLLDVLRYRERLLNGRAIGAIASCVVIVHAANVAYGYYRIGQTEPLEPGPVMLAIQTNMPQNNKLQSTQEERQRFMAEFYHLTASAYFQAQEQGARPDLVIWPETMVFGYGFEPETLAFLIEREFFPRDEFYRMLRVFVEQTGVPMLMGSPAFIGLDVDDELHSSWDELYNAAYLLDGGPPPHQRYDKHFLTPFGETMPYISNWPWLEQRLLNLGARGMTFDLDPGSGYDRLELEWSGRTLLLATPICFEVTMSRTCRKLAGAGTDDRADVFINLSNDGWFGWYEAGRIQHAQIARFRCIEHRTPMVRSVNTGLSMSIDSLGRVTGAIGESRYGEGDQPGALLASVRLDRRRTLYTIIGNTFAWIALSLTAIALAATFHHRQGSETS